MRNVRRLFKAQSYDTLDEVREHVYEMYRAKHKHSIADIENGLLAQAIDNKTLPKPPKTR